MKKWLWAGAVALAAPASQAISRIGNAHIGDPALGFSVEASDDFLLQTYEDTEAEASLVSKKLYARFSGGQTIIRPLKLRIQHFALTFPERVELTREEIPEWLGEWDDEWERVETADPCVDAYLSRNATAQTAILLWGPGKGLTLIGERGAPLAAEISRWTGTLQLRAASDDEEAACAWPSNP